MAAVWFVLTVPTQLSELNLNSIVPIKDNSEKLHLLAGTRATFKLPTDFADTFQSASADTPTDAANVKEKNGWFFSVQYGTQKSP